MKYILTFTIAIILFSTCQEKTETPATNNIAQKKIISSIPQVDTSIYETFEMQEGDTPYLMKKYFMVHLKKGSRRDHDKEEAQKIQVAHRNHLSKLREDKKICIVGPFGGESDILGIAIYSVPSLEIADSLANADPAVQAGRLTVEVFPFWAAVGSQLF